jgi:uncharacterized phage protein (TIGR01671 family)
MQRTIKFRAWEKDALVNDETDLRMWSWKELGEVGGFHDKLNNGRFEMMQYTGMKDKAGTEIYEGDVVKYNDINYTVGWNDECGCWYCYAKYEVEKSFTKVAHLMCEIIGNIHEAPVTHERTERE